MSKGKTATRARPKRKAKTALPARPQEPAGRPEPAPAAPAPGPLDPRGPVPPVWRGPAAGLATCPASVRATTPADGSAVAALWMELLRQHAPLGVEWTAADGSAERYARSVAAAPGNPRSIYLVAEMEIDGAWRIAGFVHASVKLRSSVFRESVVGEIPAILVAPDASGRGVGSALVAAAMDWFQKRGIRHVETVVAAANIAARSFYRALGFRDSAAVMWAEVPPGAGRLGPETAGGKPTGDGGSSSEPGAAEHVLRQGADAGHEA